MPFSHGIFDFLQTNANHDTNSKPLEQMPSKNTFLHHNAFPIRFLALGSTLTQTMVAALPVLIPF